MNQSVTASGMSVKAAAGTGLVISGWNDAYKANSNTEKEGYTVAGSSVALDTINAAARATTIVPTSTIDAAHWFTSTAAASNAATSSGSYIWYDDSAANFNKFSATTYLYNKVRIQTNDKAEISGKHLEIQNITASNGASQGNEGLSAELNQALRIAFVVTIGNTSKVYIYSPNEASYPAINGIKYAANAGGTGYSATPVLMSEQTNLTLNGSNTTSFAISETTIAAETIVEMYVYYDGEDANCFTNNTLNGIDQLTVSVEFVAVENSNS